jgi:hypothetical protein
MEDHGSIFMSDPNSKQYQEGYKAMGAGTPLNGNPYVHDSLAAVRWTLGWYASATENGQEFSELPEGDL